MSAIPQVHHTTVLDRAMRLDLNHHVGSELSGVDLTRLTDADVTAIQRLIADRGVLVFRHPPMSLDQQLALGRRFGKLHVHPVFADKEHAEALRIHADANSKHAAGEIWHTDVSCDLEPPAISMLRIEVTPSYGGDTAFASMYAAYDALSKPMQTFLLNLQAEHTGELPFRGRFKVQSEQQYPVNIHPVIRTHPISKRKALFVNPGFTDKIKGVSKRESKALLDMLFDHVAYNVEFQCRVRWEPHSLTMWDNRCVQHFASWDYFPQTRSGWRVTTAGERPYLEL